MNAGQYISGAGHLGLIGWLLFGGSFSSEPLPFEVADVAVITGAEYDAIVAAARPPETVTEVAMPAPPVPDAAPTPQLDSSTDTAPDAATPDPAEASQPDDAPDLSQVSPPAPAEVQDQAPQITPPAQDLAVLVPQTSKRPKARPIERVAPTPVAQPPEPEASPDDVVRKETAPDATADVVKPEDKTTAPEEAVTRIDPEAQDSETAAPKTSKRPQARPRTRMAAKPADTGGAKDARKDAVKDALAEALAAGGDDSGPSEPATPSGPPLTRGETDALKLAISRCWNLGALSSEALATTITVAFSMSEDARPVTGSIKMIRANGGSAGAAKQAFEAGRRAIIRCGARGYNLPSDKYDHWRDIEITFNPEKMR